MKRCFECAFTEHRRHRGVIDILHRSPCSPLTQSLNNAHVLRPNPITDERYGRVLDLHGRFPWEILFTKSSASVKDGPLTTTPFVIRQTRRSTVPGSTNTCGRRPKINRTR